MPKYDYVHVHSLNSTLLSKMIPKISLRDNNEPIRITFIGSIRYYDINNNLLDIFKNDKRFELHYYGTNAEVLEAYAMKNNIANAVFHGTFPLDQTAEFLKNADLINNLYGKGIDSLDYALSIKLYHGIYGRIPVLANKGTYSGEFVEKNGIGLAVDEINEKLPDIIYAWYKCLDFNELNNNCYRYLKQIANDNMKLECYYSKNIVQ